MTTAQIIALLSSPLLYMAIGALGSVIEKVGIAASIPRLVAFGKVVESVAADAPKFIANLRALLKGEPPSGGGSEPVGPAEVFPQTPDGKPLSVRPAAGMDAEFRAWRHPAWRFTAGTGCSVLLLACDPRNPPCDEARLRAIDAAYLAEVGAKCLQYTSAAECPDLPELRAKHSKALRAECSQ